MKHAGKRFKTLAIALKEIERFVRNGEHLRTGKTFANFGGMRSREILANWLISVVFNDRVGAERLTFIAIGEEIGGDGVLCDTPVAAKQAKGDAAYAEGKTLIVFVNAGGEEWLPNRVAKAVTRPILFGAFWIVGLQTVDDGAYVQCRRA